MDGWGVVDGWATTGWMMGEERPYRVESSVPPLHFPLATSAARATTHKTLVVSDVAGETKTRKEKGKTRKEKRIVFHHWLLPCQQPILFLGYIFFPW